jgi:hypothetical protein
VPLSSSGREIGMSQHHEGGCLCGAVRYRVSGDPMRVTVCHCAWCQRRTGSAFSVEALFDLAQVDISGTPSRYRSVSDESARWLDLEFCQNCGTNIGFTFERLPGRRMVDCGPERSFVEVRKWPHRAPSGPKKTTSGNSRKCAINARQKRRRR